MVKDKSYLLRENQALFDATLKEFSEKSYDLASVNEIIKNAAFNKGSFYYRFEDKFDLYLALLDYLHTIQIAIYNAKNHDFLSIEKAEELTVSLFANLYDLNEQNPAFIRLLTQFGKEDISFQMLVKKAGVESLFDRLQSRILSLALRQSLSIDSELLQHSTRMYYFHYPFSLDTNTKQKDLDRVVHYLFLEPKRQFRVEGTGLEIRFEILPMNLTFLLVNENQLLSSEEITNVDQIIADEKELLQDIRRKLKLRKIDLVSVITEGVKRNLKDYSYLNHWKNVSFSSDSYHLLNHVQKIMLVMIYLHVTGHDSMCLSNTLTYGNLTDVKLLLCDLLPLLSKTSKIVVLERQFQVFPEMIPFLFYIDELGTLQHFEFQDYSKQFEQYYLVQYRENDGSLKTHKVRKSDFDFNLYSNKNLLQISNIAILHRQDIKG